MLYTSKPEGVLYHVRALRVYGILQPGDSLSLPFTALREGHTALRRNIMLVDYGVS